MNKDKDRVLVIDDRPMTYKDFKAIMDKWDQEEQLSKNDEPDKKVTA